MKLACAYARCSTDDQGGSLPAQWTQIQDFATRDGYEIVERFQDDGVSGTALDRPGLNALLAAAADGAKWKYVLVWDRSRLGRPEDPRAAMIITYAIEQHGRTIVPLHGTPHTENATINTILEALEFGQAGEESVRKSRDVLRGQRESAKKGSIPNGKIPYGYDALYLRNGKPLRRVRYLADGSKQILSGDGASVSDIVGRDQRAGKSGDEVLVLVPGDPKAVRIIRRIFREFNGGLSARTIAARLNAEGTPSPRGKAWGRSTIKRMLSNPAYTGTLAWNRQTWAKFHAVRADGEIVRLSNPGKTLRTNVREHWTVRENCWKPLIAPAEWEKAKGRLAHRRPAALGGKGARSAFLASGLLRCTCGSHFVGCGFADKRNPNRRYEYYRCTGANERGAAACTAKRIRRDIVDGYLEKKIRELYFAPAAVAVLWHEIEGQLDAALAHLDGFDPGAEAEKRLEQVIAETDRLVGAVAAGVLDLSEVETRLSPLRQEKVELERRLTDQPGRRCGPRAIHKLRQRILAACRAQVGQEADLWPGALPEQRKRIVRLHVASLRADYGKSSIHAEFYPLVNLEQFGIHDTTLGRCVTNAKRIIETYNWQTGQQVA